MKNYVIINTETSGFPKDPFDNTTLIKLEAVKLDKNFKELGRFFQYIKSKEDLSKEIEDLTEITNTMLKEKGISLKNALGQFLKFIKDSWIISYHADFDMSFILKGIYETKIEDQKINFISLKEYLKYKTDIRKKVKIQKLANVAKYYDIKYDDLEKEWINVSINLLKILVEHENAETIEEFIKKGAPKILLPGLSKRSTKVKVRFSHGKTKEAIRDIEFIDKTPDRKVSYLTQYNAVNRYETTFYELVCFKKWGAKVIDDFLYINDINVDFTDYYIVNDINLKEDIEKLETLKNNISCLDKCQRNLRYNGTLEELKENYKILGKDNLNKIIEHIKIKKQI